MKRKTRNYTSLPQSVKLKWVDHETQPAIGPEQQNEENVGSKGRRKAAPREGGRKSRMRKKGGEKLQSKGIVQRPVI